MNPMKVGLLGLGVVGGGTWAVLARNAEEIARRAGRRIEVSRIAVRDVAKARSRVGDGVEISTDGFALVRDPAVDIVVELIGGDTLARELVLEAIAQGKHVVTANKALLAKHGNEIFAAASARGVMVAFEAAVAGGVPIIKAIREGLTANRIEWVAGIINGTTNFILSEMRARGLPFADVLAEAQRLGYAEADPTFDIEGVDAAHKLTLLASLAFGVPVQFDKAYVEGITQLAQEDIAHAERLGYRIKLLGITKRRVDGIELRVHPTLVPAERLLANVEGAMNAVLVRGDAVGPTLYYGQGAGEEPTASAVVADLVDVTRLHTADPGHRVPHLAFQPDALSDLQILSIEEVSTSYYLRMRVDDQPGVLADIARILADRSISIGSMIQQPARIGGADIIFLTHEAVEGNVNQAIEHIEALPFVRSKVTRLRMENLT
ncbi:homoserine dehydrogenase [Bordetella pertussis]|uniref:Homoserine dehydrogenase n=8 Tax=Pseudomonadota TaxID=1224 RepID=Q7VVA1_BORPE|nr:MULTISPECIES: homoserine dehydrogenase [Bordetella]ETH39775.1 homoserine dehydrogenase [Bordetella pertussis H918]ETH42258.1 homoserine dehydrogenase [Bordetella pertussis H939]ETH46272.1 homoserine dehydrogenase [Bordetella pertussis H921]ETH71142.1 homoserine dehydrogenase [Bordetella pertussis STO1-CHLA-0011]ETH82436.1 homoserine dehydrogenase [Bordetella pertussis STO1-CHOC-0017]ETH85240.1 homoserine dehydrogenase [Bordetella pertussis STO1-CHOC-0018]ETH91489.1 homoserine dehydrogenas